MPTQQASAKAKRQYYNDVICNCPSSKQLYNVTNQLLGRTKKSSLPSNINTSDLPDTFCQFFNNKIEQIRNDIDNQSADPPVFEPFTGSKFCDFEPVTEASMLELILKTASKSCNLDPIPTSLTKHLLFFLLPLSVPPPTPPLFLLLLPLLLFCLLFLFLLILLLLLLLHPFFFLFFFLFLFLLLFFFL